MTEYWVQYADAARQGLDAFRIFLAHDTSPEAQIVTLPIVNARSVPIKLALEPLGMSFDIPPATTYDLVFLGDPSDEREIEETDQGLIVWEVDSWDFGLFHNGVSLEIWPDWVD